MIWNKNELKEINKILHTKVATVSYENNEVILKKKKVDNFTNNFNSVFSNELYDTISLIFSSATKEEIDNILTKYSSVEFDINNRLHYGLISSLSKINLTKDDKYYIQIFVIVKELIGQYERVIASVINESFANINDINVIQEKINNIKQGVSNEEKQVNFLMQKIFAQTNGLDNDELFKDVINNCNSKIKNCMLTKANIILGKVAREIEVNKIKQAEEHFNDFDTKRKRQEKRTPRKYGTRSLSYS